MEQSWPSAEKPRVSQGRWRGGELSPMTRMFLPKPDYDDPRSRRPSLPSRTHEVKTAKAEEWAGFWFEPPEVDAWLRAWPNAVASVAAAFRDAGVNPTTAMMCVDRGKPCSYGLPLAIRVSCGELAAEDAIAELRAAGVVA